MSRFRYPLRLTALTLLIAVAGCGSSGNGSVDIGNMDVGQPDLGISSGDPCDDFGSSVLYRVTDLHVPTLADVNSGVPVGHNVDFTDEVCGVPDFPGGVDNTLVDGWSALGLFDPPAMGFDLQTVIDAALRCTDATPAECTRLDLIVRVGTGVGCALVAIEDGEGTTLVEPFVGSLDGSGNLRALVVQFDLSIPYHASTGPVDIRLGMNSMVLTANVGESGLTDIVLGGAIPSSSFEAMLMELLPLLADAPTFEDIQPMLASLYDVELEADCSALSVGFTGSAEVLTP